MSSPLTGNLYILVPALVGATVLVWYLYQVGSRKKSRVRYKLKRIAVGMPVYVIAVVVLRNNHGFTDAQAALISAVMAMGIVWLLVNPPRQSRRIPTAVRRAVIARDLESKGLTWDAKKYHIDHIVPFSKGGDNSIRNLRVEPKAKNLRKGNKMPRLRDFIR